MKRISWLLLVVLLLTSSRAWTQGVFVLDQYSSLNEYAPTHAGTFVQSLPPGSGQSFTPSLSAIDYIRLNLNDSYPGPPGPLDPQGQYNGATMYLTLRADSMFGPALGTTTPVYMPDGYAAITTFLFPTTIALTAGTTYYFELFVQPGSDVWNIIGGGYNYPRGSGFTGGVAGAGDFWFQEGIIIPEPSSVVILLAGGALLYARSRPGRKRRQL